MDTDGSSPGLPWKEYGFRTKGEVKRDPHAWNSIRTFWHRVKYGSPPAPPDCAAYLRAHLVEEGKQKVRAVWGYPATISFQEACFAIPLINAYKIKGPIAYGYETARGGCRRLAARFAKHSNFLSSDYRKFDKTIPSWLIRIAFDILCSNIDFTKYQDAGVPHSRSLHQAWLYLVDYFIRTPVRLCNGRRYRKNRGVASGSYFTQLVDSIVNWIVTTYSIRSQQVKVEDILVMGDDSLVATNEPVDMQQFASKAAECGMIINTDKTQSSSNVHELKFLGYYINYGVPKRDAIDLWAALRFPERPDYTFNDFASRTLGLMIANFGVDYDFDLCCRNILNVRSYRVVYSPHLKRFLKILGIDACQVNPHLFSD